MLTNSSYEPYETYVSGFTFLLQQEGPKKSRIQETKHLSTDADSSTDTKKNPASKAKLAKKKTCFLRGDFTPFMSKRFQI